MSETGNRNGRKAPDDSFDVRLKAARDRQTQQAAPRSTGASSSMAQGLRLGLEMVSGVVAGGAIGWFLDRWLKTEPWLLILFAVLGIAAGLMNVMRAAAAMGRADAPDDDGPERRD